MTTDSALQPFVTHIFTRLPWRILTAIDTPVTGELHSVDSVVAPGGREDVEGPEHDCHLGEGDQDAGDTGDTCTLGAASKGGPEDHRSTATAVPRAAAMERRLMNSDQHKVQFFALMERYCQLGRLLPAADDIDTDDVAELAEVKTVLAAAYSIRASILDDVGAP
jgi:hypothetical protein